MLEKASGGILHLGKVGKPSGRLMTAREKETLKYRAHATAITGNNPDLSLISRYFHGGDLMG